MWPQQGNCNLHLNNKNLTIYLYIFRHHNVAKVCVGGGQGGIVGKWGAQKSQPGRSLGTSRPTIFGLFSQQNERFGNFWYGLWASNQCILPSELFFSPRLLLPPALTPIQVSVWGPLWAWEEQESKGTISVWDTEPDPSFPGKRNDLNRGSHCHDAFFPFTQCSGHVIK